MIRRIPLARSLRAGALLVVVLVFLAPAAWSATITVNSAASGTGGTGDCTLTEAIQAANSDTAVDGCTAGSGADIINIGGCHIVLLAPDHVDPTDGPIGLPDITTDVAIAGNVPSDSILERDSGAPDFSIFRVAPGGTLTFNDLTVRGGRNLGGGAVVNRGTLQIVNVDMENHEATDPAVGGGAIINYPAGVAAISVSSFTNNISAGPAGAIRNDSSATISGSTFTGNKATRGGAIEAFPLGNDTAISDSSFFNNEAQFFGGAVHSHNGPLDVLRCFFFDNVAGTGNGSQNGGGAIEGDGTFTITETLFEGNSSVAVGNIAGGGAIRSDGASVTVHRSTFANNFVSSPGGTANGGAIETDALVTAQLVITNSTFSGNVASSNGGAIDHRFGSLDMNNVTLAQNLAAGFGGGVNFGFTASLFTMRNTILASNTSTAGGPDCRTESAQILTSQGHNLIGDNTACSIQMGTGDIIGTGASPVDPILGPLDTGNIVPLHGLLTGSPAIDSGDPGTPGTGGTTCEATDQRSVARPDGVACDIGAFEGVLLAADLAVTKADSPDPVMLGNNVTYTLTVTNNGPDDATSVSLVDTVPASTSIVSAVSSQGTCTPAFTTVFCNLGSLASGANATATIVVTTSAAGQITNTALVTAAEVDPDFTNNFASEDTFVLRDLDLAITKVDSPDPVLAGSNLAYDITLANNGSTALTGVAMTDVLPTSVTFVSANSTQGSCSLSGAVVTCTIGTLAGQATVDISIVVTPNTPGTIANDALAVANETDPDTSNNMVRETTYVQGSVALMVTKTDSPDPVTAGNNLVYTISVFNGGSNNATNVVLTDILDPRTNFLSATPSQGTCTFTGSVTCNLGTLPVDFTATVTVIVQTTLACTLNNTATVTSDDFDPNPNDDVASEFTTVVPGSGSADLGVTKSGAPDPVALGSNLTYTIGVSNSGPDPATNVVLTDPLPFGTTFVSATPTQGTCTPLPNVTVVCNLGTLASGANATVTIVVTASVQTTAGAFGLDNGASVSADETDPDTSNNFAQITTQVMLPTADLSVTKTSSPDPVTVGNNLTYTLIVNNFGPDPAPNAVVTDVLPTGVVFVSATPPQGSCSLVTGNVVCNLGTLAVTGFQIPLIVQPTAPGTLQNTVSIQGTVIDSNGSGFVNFTTAVAAPSSGVDLSITKTHSSNFAVGVQDTYTITVTNVGTAAATGTITVTDTLPAELNFVVGTGTGWSCSAAGQDITCTNPGPLAVSSSSVLTITVQVLGPAGSVTNTAMVSTAGDTNAANDSASDPTNINAFSCTKTLATSGDWNLGSNWNPVGVPGAGDDVCIPAGRIATLDTNQTIRSLTMDGRLDMSAGSLTFTVASQMGGTFNFSGGTLVGSSADLTLNGPWNWSGGTVTGGAQVHVNGDVTMSGGAKTINGHAVNMNGTTTWTAGDVQMVNGAFWSILPSGTVDMQGDFSVINGGGPIPTMNIGGSLQKTMGNGTASFAVVVNNSGMLTVNTGNVTLSAGGTSSGSFSIAAGGILEFGGGTHTLTATSSVTGTGNGTVSFTGGTANLAGAYDVIGGTSLNGSGTTANFSGSVTNSGPFSCTGGDVSFTGSATGLGAVTINSFCNVDFSNTEGMLTLPSLSVSSGVLSGTSNLNITGSFVCAGSSVVDSTGDITIGGLFTWTFGQIRGSGTVLALGGMLLNPVATTNLVLDGRTLENAGSAIWNPTPPTFIILDNGAALVNRLGATFDIQTGGDFFNSSGPATINNAGTFMKSAGGGSTNIPAGIPFNNSGTLIAANGTLNFQGPFTQTSGSTSLSGGGSISTSTSLDIQGGVLGGNQPGTITGTVNNTGGSMAPGFSPGLVIINGGYTQGPGASFDVEISGVTLGLEYDSVSADVGMVDGTLNVSLIGGFTPALGDNFLILVCGTSCSGTFATTNLPTLPAGLAWSVEYNATDVTLRIVSSTGTADLSLAKSAAPDPVGTGNNLTYTLTVTNNGPSSATSVMLTDTLPAGVSFVSSTPSQGTCSGTATVSCDLGTIVNGANATVTIVVTTSAAGTITNTATVSATETDPNTADNDVSIMTTVSPATFLGPSPYLCQTDSPFFAAIQAGTVFLETFEDGLFNAPGVSAVGTVVGPGGNTDSVDCDDGSIDGSGTFGRSFFFTSGATGITFTFNPNTLGSFPTQAGIVWTDAGFGATVTFEAFDAGGASLGVVQAIALADNTNFGTTAEDRFFGVTNAGGISAIKISNTSGGIEVDHLQYGPVPPFADLAVTKLDTPDPVNIGANITYDITVTNNGPVDATGVMLADTLPAGVTFVSATPSQGTCSGTTTVSCGLIDILAGNSATVTLVVAANTVGSVSNTASATAAEADFNLANNSATATTAVSPLADLSITKMDSPDPVQVGGTLTYTIGVSNKGPLPATNVTLTDVLAASLTFVSTTPSQGTCSGTTTVTCNLGTINVGAAATVTIVVTPGAAAFPAVSNTASVSATEADPVPGDNSATATTTITPVIDLAVTKVATPDPGVVNNNLTYTVTVTNNGPSAATGVVVDDTLPSGPSFVSASASQGTCSGTATVTCTLGNLASGASATVTIVIQPTAQGSVSNTATVTANETDSNTANNTATISTNVVLVTFNLSTPSSSSGTVVSGGTSTFTIMVDCTSAPQVVTLSATTTAPATTVVFVPPAVTCNTPGTTTVTVSVATTICIWVPPNAGPRYPDLPWKLVWPWAALLLLWFAGWATRRQAGRRWGPAFALVCLVVALGACAGSDTSLRRGVIGTPPGTYTVTVNATSSGVTKSLSFTLNVTPP